jgi:hypothetical protein
LLFLDKDGEIIEEVGYDKTPVKLDYIRYE